MHSNSQYEAIVASGSGSVSGSKVLGLVDTDTDTDADADADGFIFIFGIAERGQRCLDPGCIHDYNLMP